jgi:hypothetical protein
MTRDFATANPSATITAVDDYPSMPPLLKENIEPEVCGDLECLGPGPYDLIYGTLQLSSSNMAGDLKHLVTRLEPGAPLELTYWVPVATEKHVAFKTWEDIRSDLGLRNRAWMDERLLGLMGGAGLENVKCLIFQFEPAQLREDANKLYEVEGDMISALQRSDQERVSNMVRRAEEELPGMVFEL